MDYQQISELRVVNEDKKKLRQRDKNKHTIQAFHWLYGLSETCLESNVSSVAKLVT